MSLQKYLKSRFPETLLVCLCLCLREPSLAGRAPARAHLVHHSPASYRGGRAGRLPTKGRVPVCALLRRRASAAQHFLFIQTSFLTTRQPPLQQKQPEPIYSKKTEIQRQAVRAPSVKLLIFSRLERRLPVTPCSSLLLANVSLDVISRVWPAERLPRLKVAGAGSALAEDARGRPLPVGGA
ncbi:Hypothetical predicted protein [Marmota monax]|uniref:Uncharacterized protein n=1 Tax=Marmota monax TaxID=9995 RepID=A0A5E4AV08_MARMO|nr:Hypothetical predicted protein [Marmota monax]